MKKDKKIITNKRRSFIKKAGLLTLGAAGATAIKAPYAYSASNSANVANSTARNVFGAYKIIE